MPVVQSKEPEAMISYTLLNDKKEIQHYTYCMDDSILICFENKGWTWESATTPLLEDIGCVSWVHKIPEENIKCCCII